MGVVADSFTTFGVWLGLGQHDNLSLDVRLPVKVNDQPTASGRIQPAFRVAKFGHSSRSRLEATCWNDERTLWSWRAATE